MGGWRLVGWGAWGGERSGQKGAGDGSPQRHTWTGTLGHRHAHAVAAGQSVKLADMSGGAVSRTYRNSTMVGVEGKIGDGISGRGAQHHRQRVQAGTRGGGLGAGRQAAHPAACGSGGLADCAAVGHPRNVQVLRPLLLDMRAGEGAGAQRLLRLVHWPPLGHTAGRWGSRGGVRVRRCKQQTLPPCTVVPPSQ